MKKTEFLLIWATVFIFDAINELVAGWPKYSNSTLDCIGLIISNLIVTFIITQIVRLFIFSIKKIVSRQP